MSTSNEREKALGKRATSNFKRRLSTKSIAESKPFTFIVGPDEAEFTIHSALVARQSQVLNTLVNGPYKEALHRRVNWSHVDESIFLSFWEFIYNGDYENPECNDDASSELYDSSSEDTDDDLNLWSQVWLHYARIVPRFEDKVQRERTKKKKRPKKKRPKKKRPKKKRPKKKRPKKKRPKKKRPKKTSKLLLWEDFVDSWSPKFRPLNEPWIDPDTMMHHAKVCAFADCYCIDGLLELSLNKLFIALEGCTLWGEDFDNIIALLQFCPELFVPDKLRRITVHYIICHIEALQQMEEFKSFLENLSGSMKSTMDEVVSELLRKGLPIDRHAYYGVTGARRLADESPCQISG
ncbi:hypothetical protein FBEOM_13413 [Fusarium beomiforme]|uniref:BTB domain-containing protein n=1 Tax=Fusarium beomiforme TaxID=44412 RepID=A0A9P5A6S5_9HYPO|nr:hypothetical protein FBEOM_13413 [Fusarium beomiforme]